MGLTHRSLVPFLGAGAVLISLAGMLASIAIAPRFSVLEHPLSALGRSDWPSATVFNGALIASGVLGIGFVSGLWADSVNGLTKYGLFLFGVAAAFVLLIGIYPTPHPYHYGVSVGFYLVLSVAFFLYGTGTALAGRQKIGIAMIGLGLVHTAAWVVWWALAEGVGIAGPEAIGALGFSIWVCVMAADMHRKPSESTINR